MNLGVPDWIRRDVGAATLAHAPSAPNERRLRREVDGELVSIVKAAQA